MKSSIVDFRRDFNIPEIQKLAFHLPYALIIGTHHCGNIIRKAFKRRSYLQYVLCRRNYAEFVVARFSHQIKSEYYCGNMFVSIEGVYLE